MTAVAVALALIVTVQKGEATAATKFQKDAAIIDGCLRCHAAQGLNAKDGNEKISLYVNEQDYRASAHGTNACTSCHTDIKDYPHVGAAKGQVRTELVYDNCQKCHENTSKMFAASAHAKKSEGRTRAYCADCHGKHNIFKPQQPASLVYKTNIPHTCTKCHNHEVAESYEESFHGKAVILGSKKAASCVDCHGYHDIVSQTETVSPVNKANVATTCGKCHAKTVAGFSEGKEHFVIERGGPGEPAYWTLKFMVWLTIICNVVVVLHMLMELRRKLINLKKSNPNLH